MKLRFAILLVPALLSAACATPTGPGSRDEVQRNASSSLIASYAGSGDSGTIYASGNVQLTAGGSIRSALYAAASTQEGIGSYFLFASQPRHGFSHGISAVVNDTVAGDYPLLRSCEIDSPANGRCALLVLVITPNGAFSTSSVYYAHEGAISLTRDGDRIRGTFSGVAHRDGPGDLGIEPNSEVTISDGSFDLPILPQAELGPLMGGRTRQAVGGETAS